MNDVRVEEKEVVEKEEKKLLSCKTCKKEVEIKSISKIGEKSFIQLLCNHIYSENLQESGRKNLSKFEKMKMISEDLLNYHGLSERFQLHFDGRKESVLGLCKIGVKGEGIIVGNIVFNRKHFENDPEEMVIDTILHEISHAITPGAGHTEIWRATDLSIGGNGQAKAWCSGTTKILYKICPVCHVKAEEVSHEINEEENKRIIFLICGHSYEEKLSEKLDTTWKFADDRKPFPYQYEGIDFARKSGFRCGILDEMGLGKTIQGIGVLFKFPETLPAVIICKASLTYNWLREYHNATGGEFVQIIEGSSEKPNPIFKVVIVSFDTLGRIKDIDNWFSKFIPKTVIIDECQQIKNSEAKRTNAVRKVCKLAQNVIALSGTPIKNHAGEYFPVLNILRPEIFPSQLAFERNHVHQGWDGYKLIAGGLRDPERFKKITADFLIRRTRDEVLPDLPKIRRDFKFYPLGKEVKVAYEKELSDFNDYYMNRAEKDTPEDRQSNILAYMSRMRHITGFAKVQPVLDYVEEFIENNNGNSKLTIFHHHVDVAQMLAILLKERNINFVQMTSNDDSETRMRKIDQFRDEKAVFLVPTLAGGEGINLQFCENAVIMEREWNPSNEEQAEGRFSRIGSTATSVNVVYPTAIGTIDEYFARIVERKRQIVEEAMKGKKLDTGWNESGMMKDLAEALYKFGMSGWKLDQ